MNIKEIRQLVKLMVDNDLSELDIAEGDAKVRLKRGVDDAGEAAPVPAADQAPAAAAPTAGAAEELFEVRSPMVGTFYTTASPDSEPYVSIGSAVADESVVCIVEAMKVMNEIKAECTGTVAEICVRNEQPVEYGQVLFRVRVA